MDLFFFYFAYQRQRNIMFLIVLSLLVRLELGERQILSRKDCLLSTVFWSNSINFLKMAIFDCTVDTLIICRNGFLSKKKEKKKDVLSAQKSQSTYQ